MPIHRLRPLVRAPLAALLLAPVGAGGCAAPAPPRPVRRPVATDQGFTSVETDDVDVVIRVGPPRGVSARCDPELERHLHVEVAGDVLRASLGGESWHPFSMRERTCAVDVSMPVLRSVRSDGSGDVRVIGSAEGLRAVTLQGSGDARLDAASGDETRFTLSGSGDLWLRRLEARRAEFSLSGSGDVDVGEGAVTDARLMSSGSGDVNAKSLAADSADVRVSGSGDVLMTARRRAELRVSGSGDVIITGAPPECHAQSSGSGSALCR